MAEKPPESDDKEAERRFNETLGRMLNTPHQPHKPPKLPPKKKST
jgi:hypothetical protein